MGGTPGAPRGPANTAPENPAPTPINNAQHIVFISPSFRLAATPDAVRTIVVATYEAVAPAMTELRHMTFPFFELDLSAGSWASRKKLDCLKRYQRTAPQKTAYEAAAVVSTAVRLVRIGINPPEAVFVLCEQEGNISVIGTWRTSQKALPMSAFDP
jgi:hypothetical protein